MNLKRIKETLIINELFLGGSVALKDITETNDLGFDYFDPEEFLDLEEIGNEENME